MRRHAPAAAAAGPDDERPTIEQIAADLHRLGRQRLGVATRSQVWQTAVTRAYDEQLRLACQCLGVDEHLSGLNGVDLEIERLRVEGELLAAGLRLPTADSHGAASSGEAVRRASTRRPRPSSTWPPSSGSRCGSARRRRQGVNARLAPPDNYHVTLAFLGDVADERADARGRGAGARCVAVGAPEVRIGGGGRFGRGKFTVLWAGVRGDVDPLRALAGVGAAELRRARLPFDDKPLKPHLTIARPGDRLTARRVDADRDALGRVRGPGLAGERDGAGAQPPRPQAHATTALATWPRLERSASPGPGLRAGAAVADRREELVQPGERLLATA